jgi:tRNA dimethylallyltransferase
VALVGPTGSGKSAVALELAPLLGGEIVTVDSMQVYRGMDIGTAKPTAADQTRVKHHLIDLLDLNQTFDAAAFRQAALPVIDRLIAAGKTPILCGGTGFYLAAVRDGLASEPARNAALRAELESAPLDQLVAELRRLDAAAYAKIDLRNRRRVVRALEVVRLTGRPFARERARRMKDTEPNGPDEASWHVFGLLRDPSDLKARIEMRVEQMFDQGLVAETRALLDVGLAQNRTALQAIGYRQVVEHLRGERSLAETKALILSRTRQLAKKQLTWFRRQLRVTWLDVEADESAQQTAERVARRLPE